MKKMLSLLLAALLLVTPALAADWPQFLGMPGTQGVSGGPGATGSETLALRWDKNTGNTWNDVPGTPITAEGYVYYYSSQYLRKLDLATGEEVATAQVYGEPVNQFFINIAYGEGKIFVPCQTDNLDDGLELTGCFLRVFDAETLEQLYVTETIATGQMQSPVMYHDGYFVTGTYSRNCTYAGFTADDEDPTRSDEVKRAAWTVDTGERYRLSFNGAAFQGDYCYFGCADTLYVVNYRTGETRSMSLGEGYAIKSTIVYSPEMGRLYVACCHPDGCAAVFSYALKADGMPDTETTLAWVSGTEGGGTQSSPVIYNGRLYLGGGGSTMGSAEPFHVIDAATMEGIYSVPILTKGSAGISTAYATEENGHTVYIYLVPYAPTEESSQLWILKDSQGQTEGEYEVIDGIGQKQYCSQSVLVAEDGSLIWYNDAARLYCYENTAYVAPAPDGDKASFSDTAGHWAEKEIEELVGRGVIQGMGDGTFAPDAQITRAHFIRLLANLSGEDLAAYTGEPFSDVTSGDWFAPAIAWAVARGVIPGDSGEAFAPNEPIARQDMAFFLARYLEQVAGSTLPEVQEAIAFTDGGEIASYAAEAVTIMQRAGIITGIAQGEGYRFDPAGEATRAHASVIIIRLLRILEGQDG